MWTIVLAIGCGFVVYAAYALLGARGKSDRAGGRPVRYGARKLGSRLAPLLARIGSGGEAPRGGLTAAAGDYDRYDMPRGETTVVCLAAAAVLMAIGFLFYKNAIACLLLALAAFAYPRFRRKQLIRKRKDELRRQFKHALYALSTALSAGKSVENAIREAADDLRLLYPDGKIDMIRELERINRRTENGEPIERSLLDFGARSGIEDIRQFAESFAACKRTGGDLAEVMRRTANLIGEKMEIEQDISVLLAQKRFEARALGWIPFGIVAFLAYGSPDYMAPLYSGAGHLIMTTALALLGFSQWLAHRIMNIGA